jgi:ATP synthase protein I
MDPAIKQNVDSRMGSDQEFTDPWVAGWQDTPVTPLTRDEAQALMAQEPPVSPWRIVGLQAGVGIVVALLVWGITGRLEGGWSALYGAAVVVVPAVLMARGLTSPLSRANAATAAMSFMAWQGLKMAVSVVMLIVAPRIVPMLMWPALLAGLVVCIKVYWVALLWRRPTTK